MKRLLLLLVLCGCHDKYERQDTAEADHSIPNEAAVAGLACPSSATLMRAVTLPNGTAFCIDAFEASVDGGALGNAAQTADDTSDARDGSTQAKATVGLRAAPATQVSFYQALAACANAGKRLCTVDEWERACRGPESLVYPYGDTVDAKACNGFYNDVTTPLVTGSLDTCGSAYGVYDLSGNVAEWTASATERIPGTGIFNDRAVRGGSYQANAVGLRCVGDDYHDPPATARADLGFRCCL